MLGADRLSLVCDVSSDFNVVGRHFANIRNDIAKKVAKTTWQRVIVLLHSEITFSIM